MKKTPAVPVVNDSTEPRPVDTRLLRCYCETDLAGILKPRTMQDIQRGDSLHRAWEVHSEILPKLRPGLESMTPRQHAAAACLFAVETTEAPFVPDPQHPNWTEAELAKAKRLTLADGLHKYMLHLTEAEARPLVAMDEALQRFKAKCDKAWNDAAPVEGSPATDEPPQAVAKRRDLLTPLIEQAQRECSNSFDAAAVWPVLVEYAKRLRRPLIGVCEDGIKWENESDAPCFFTMKNLRDRLRRTAEKAR